MIGNPYCYTRDHGASLFGIIFSAINYSVTNYTESNHRILRHQDICGIESKTPILFCFDQLCHVCNRCLDLRA